MTDHQDEQVNQDPVTVEQTDAITAAMSRERMGYELREAVARKKIAALSRIDSDDAAVRIQRTLMQVELDRVTARQKQVDDAISELTGAPARRPNARAGRQTRNH
jgi:hypothetical protein